MTFRIPFDPPAYQRDLIRWQINNTGMVVSPMGSGKTAATLSALEWLRRQDHIRSALILAPMQVCLSTWPQELMKWEHLKNIDFAILAGRDAIDRTNLILHPFLIVNYELIGWLTRYRTDFDAIAIDEVTKFKNHRSKRLRMLVDRLRGRARRVWGLTASPVTEDDPQALWGQWHAIDGGNTLGSWSDFRDRYLIIDTYSHTMAYRPDAVGDIAARVAARTIRVPESMVDDQRPGLTVQDHWCGLPADVMREHRRMIRHLVATLRSSDEEVIKNAGVATQLVHQLVGGALYQTDRTTWRELHDEKLKSLEDVIDGHEPNAGVLVAYWYRHELDRIRQYLNGMVEARQARAIDLWNERKITPLALHPASAGHGLNLQSGGNILIYYSLPWSHGLYDQTIGRLWRRGQVRHVTVHRLVARDTVDEAVLAAYERKCSTEQMILEMFG